MLTRFGNTCGFYCCCRLFSALHYVFNIVNPASDSDIELYAILFTRIVNNFSNTVLKSFSFITSVETSARTEPVCCMTSTVNPRQIENCVLIIFLNFRPTSNKSLFVLLSVSNANSITQNFPTNQYQRLPPARTPYLR